MTRKNSALIQGPLHQPCIASSCLLLHRSGLKDNTTVISLVASYRGNLIVLKPCAADGSLRRLKFDLRLVGTSLGALRSQSSLQLCGSHRIIDNFKNLICFSEFLLNHFYKIGNLESSIKMSKPGCNIS